MLVQVNDYDISTVVNRNDFSKAVEFRQCVVEGRSLVAKRPLFRGDIVLVEHPSLQYLLEPNCRSSLSPCYSKPLWIQLENIVDNDDFRPGVPAAMLAYLQLSSNKRRMFDFFYLPKDHEHPTVQLIRKAVYTAVATIPEFHGLDADEMSYFVLKIYSNAHTVVFQHKRIAQTHTRKQKRRRQYSLKNNDIISNFYEKEPKFSNQRSMICLMSWGSKFAHSCAPNLFVNYEPTDNVMVFRVVRPLDPGDILSFSYLPEDDMSLGSLVCGTTVLRQEKLQKFKFFNCSCARCMDYDWSRGQDVEGCEAYYRQGEWKCRQCHKKLNAVFEGDHERHVEQIAMAFSTMVHGINSIDNNLLRMIEPYLQDLLQSTEKPAVPKRHWTYGYIHSVLAAYHLKLFPQFFGKGLAESLNMLNSGFKEAATYINFLNSHIWTCSDSSSLVNPMAAFFAGWKTLVIVMDILEESFQRTTVICHPKVTIGTTLNSSDYESDKEDIKTTTELLLKPCSWNGPIQQIINIVQLKWLPVVTEVFQQRRSVVVDDMVHRINKFIKRIDLLSAK